MNAETSKCPICGCDGLQKKVGTETFEYKGKNVKSDIIKKYSAAKDMRKKYRSLLSVAKKQINFLKGSLRGKEAI